MTYAKHVIFEGIDGTGKDTQIEMLALKVKTLGKKVLFLRTPTGGPQEGSLSQWHKTKSGELLRLMWRMYPAVGNSKYPECVAEYVHQMTGPVFLADMFELDHYCWGTGAVESRDEETYKEWASRNFCIQSRSWASTFAYQHNQFQTQMAALAAGRTLKSPDVWIYLHQDIQITLDRIAARAAQGGKDVQSGLYEKEGRLRATKEAFENLFHESWEDKNYGPVIWIRADQPAEDVHKDIVTALTDRDIL